MQEIIMLNQEDLILMLKHMIKVSIRFSPSIYISK